MHHMTDPEARVAVDRGEVVTYSNALGWHHLEPFPHATADAVRGFRCSPASIAQEHAADMAACGVAL